MSALTVTAVSKSYGGTEALRDVSFDCREGEFFTLFGPSGAGKTTLLELIAGIKSDYTGGISIKGQPVEGRPMQDRNVAMAFESYALYPHMSVGENIAFPLHSPRAPRRSSAEIGQVVQKTADELGIGHLLARNPRELSGGQKQRVSLARALVRDADVYLLDEPIAHLDAKLRTVARANLKAMARNRGATIVYVTHDYREALGLSDRLLILNEGRVLQIGAPRDVYARPASDFVGHLIGDPAMNLLDGKIEASDGQPRFVAGRTSFELNARLSQAAAARIDEGRTDVRLGVRPSGVGVHVTDPGGGTALPVYTVEHTAEHQLVYFEIAGRYFGGTAANEPTLHPGQVVWLTLAEERGHLFDATFALESVTIGSEAA